MRLQVVNGGIHLHNKNILFRHLALEILKCVTYLPSWISTRVARKNISIHMSHSSVPGIINTAWTIRIDRTGRLEDTNNREVIPITFQTRKATGGSQLRHIHPGGGKGLCKTKSKDSDK